MEKVIAKFHCDQAAEKVSQWSPDYKPEHVEMSVVQGQTEEDKVFQQASPGGELKLVVINQAAKGFFKPGKKYYVSFEEAPEGK